MENTQATHYGQLKAEPWDIMSLDFTHEEFVGYLKGNILKYVLRRKKQDIDDAKKIKHYAEKLIEVLTEKALNEDDTRKYDVPAFTQGYYFAEVEKLTPLDELELNKWYDTRDFELEELQRKLPIGTKIVVLTDANKDCLSHNPANTIEDIEYTTVREVYKGTMSGVRLITRSTLYGNNWFKIIEYPKE